MLIWHRKMHACFSHEAHVWRRTASKKPSARLSIISCTTQQFFHTAGSGFRAVATDRNPLISKVIVPAATLFHKSNPGSADAQANNYSSKYEVAQAHTSSSTCPQNACMQLLPPLFNHTGYVTHTLTITSNATVNPDGFSRAVLLVNGKFPSPPLRFRLGVR